MRFQKQFEVKAPPEKVWAVMEEVQRWPEWTESMTSVELVDGATLAPGAKAKIKQPRIPATVWEVTDVSPNQGFAWVSKSPGGRTIADHRIEPSEGGSRVTLSVDMTGPVNAAFGVLFGGLTRRYLEMEAEGLSRRAEEG